MYTTVEEAHQKLLNTVVLYDNIPYLVRAIRVDAANNIVLKITSCSNSNSTIERFLNNPKFDFYNLGCRLGYVNWISTSYKDTTFVIRTGIRKAQQTQGLSKHNVISSKLHGCHDAGIHSQSIDFSNLIFNPGFVSTFKSEFPSVTEAVENLKVSITNVSLAFDRNFALIKPKIGPVYIYYKNKPVGFIENNKFNIHEDYNYLKESLEDIREVKLA